VKSLKFVNSNFRGFSKIRRISRHQWGNQNLYIEEEQTTQWPKDKEQMDKQRSTKHYKGVHLL